MKIIFCFVVLFYFWFHFTTFRFVSVSKISYRVVCFQEIVIFWKKIVVGCFIHTYRNISVTENTLVKKNRTRLDTKFKCKNCVCSLTDCQTNTLKIIYTFCNGNVTLYFQFSLGLECVHNEQVILSTIQLQFISYFVV